MKKFFLLFTLLSAVTFSSCDLEDDPIFISLDYTGVMSVIPLDGGPSYTWENVHFSLLEEGNHTFTLWMYNTHFVPQMPPLTMAVPDISFANSAVMTSLLGNNIVPFVGGTPYDRYLITELSGTVANSGLNIAFNCMGFRVTFVGMQNMN
ncbi:MAG: hypothetical protein RSB29_02425 [Alistipes sp.]